MREYSINRLINYVRQEIPSNFEISIEALERCKTDLMNDNGLIGPEIQFLQLFHPHQALYFDKYFTNAETSLLRPISEDDMIFWKKFHKSEERKKILKKYFSIL